MRKGVHAEHEATLSGLGAKIDVAADSGALVPAISLECASIAWRSQDAEVKQLESMMGVFSAYADMCTYGYNVGKNKSGEIYAKKPMKFLSNSWAMWN